MRKNKKEVLEVKEKKPFVNKLSDFVRALTFLTKFIIILIIIIIVWYIYFIRKSFKIYIVYPQASRNTAYFYIVLVSIMLLVFIVSCGFTFDIKNKKTKFLIFMLIIVFIIYGLSEISIGLRIREDFNLLTQKEYEGNNIKGVKFFIYNFSSFWIFIYIISLFFESEKQ